MARSDSGAVSFSSKPGPDRDACRRPALRVGFGPVFAVGAGDIGTWGRGASRMGRFWSTPRGAVGIGRRRVDVCHPTALMGRPAGAGRPGGAGGPRMGGGFGPVFAVGGGEIGRWGRGASRMGRFWSTPRGAIGIGPRRVDVCDPRAQTGTARRRRPPGWCRRPTPARADPNWSGGTPLPAPWPGRSTPGLAAKRAARCKTRTRHHSEAGDGHRGAAGPDRQRTICALGSAPGNWAPPRRRRAAGSAGAPEGCIQPGWRGVL
jgi:hypothetical protein